MPKLRVIASFYECRDEVARGLDTVLSQTMTDFECIVVDDHSGDGTPDAIVQWLDQHRDPRFRFAPNAENKGIAWVRSHHSENADVAYLAFQEAGDRSTPDRYGRCAAMIEADPGIGMVGCGFRNVVEETGRSYVKSDVGPEAITFARLVAKNCFAGGELFYSYPALQEVGGIVPDLPYGEDYYTTLRIARHYRIGYIPDVLYERGVSFKGLSFRPESFVRQCLCVLAVRDLATDGPADHASYLRDRGGLDSYRHDRRLRPLLLRGALRSAYIGDWRGGAAIARAALAA